MRGSGTGMTYDQKRDVLSLADQFEMTDTGQEGQPPYEVHAGSGVWARADKNMRFERAVKMVRGGQMLEADVATTYMTPDGQHMQMLQLQGNASITGVPSGQEPGTRDQTPASPVRSMHARDINLTYAEDGQALKEAVLAGDGLAEVASGGGESTTRIAGEFIDFVLEPDGTTMRSLAARGASPESPARLDMAAVSTAPRRVIRAATIQGPAPGKKAAPGRGLTTMRFSGNVVYNEAPAPPGKLRTATARTLDLALQPNLGAVDEAQFSGNAHLKEGTSLEASARDARYDVKAGTFEFTGNDDQGGPPFVKDQDQATIRATRIVVDPKTRKVSALGGVQTIIQPAQKRPDGTTARTPGILSRDRPALAASDELQYDGAASQAAFTSKVQSKLWQDQGNSIYAVQITVDDAKGDLSAKGAVTSMMKLEQPDTKTKGKERVNTTVSADEMVYADASRRATYSGHAQMKGGAQGNMKADKAVLVLTADGTALDRLEGYDNVELEDEGTPTTGRRKTTADRLIYTAADQCYKVTGKLVKIDEECYGETLCRTLTFYRSVDRMIVDGNAERRTQTKGGQGCKKEPHFD
jgi:lipopolysaccharide export system protein LptA